MNGLHDITVAKVVARQPATSNYEVRTLAVDGWVLVPNVTIHPSTASVPVTALLCVTVSIKELNIQLYSPNGSNIKTTNNLTKHNKQSNHVPNAARLMHV